MRDREFARLIAVELPAVRAFARALAPDHNTAEDAMQETLLRAWRYIDSYDRRRPFQPWLIGICRHCVADLLVRERKHEDAVIDRGSAQLASVEAVVELFDLIRSLPMSQREVLVVISVLGYSYEETAGLLGIPIGTVRSRVSRARVALSAMLQHAEQGIVGGDIPGGRPA